MTWLPEELAAAEGIVRRVAADAGVTFGELVGRARRPDLIEARRTAVVEVRRLTSLSYPQLGRLLGGRDHSTIYAMVQAAHRPRRRRAAGLTCDVDGCGRPVQARGWCSTHYARWRRHGSPMADVPVGPGGGKLELVGCGTSAAYARGCRCGRCRRAHARRQRDGYRPRTVPAGPAIAHVAALQAAGLSQTEIARRAGLAQTTVSPIARGKVDRVYRDTAAQLLAVAVPPPSCEVCDGPALAGGRWCAVGRCEARRGRWSWSRGAA